mmetsp:Transcript_16763/g.52450  ORF Transcript_16763/g.52450 Transcript_16763/m.52450 type:complete len:273 (+) Transcript_16763:212-1030(+)
MLPRGQVLLHCGDLLLEGAGLCSDGSAPQDLERALLGLHRPPYSQFQWVFLTGGNHDRALHDLWASDPEQLYGLLPSNVVLLQAPANLTPALSSTCAARDKSVRNCVENGAVKLSPDLTLSKPTSPGMGCVIAGSGVSLANSMGTSNTAFQLPKDDAASLQQAAEALLQHMPAVVLTHGPPQGHRDLGRGDPSLAKAVSSCSSVKVHVFGHVHETYGAEFADGRVYINACLSTPLFVPAQEPFVFDVGPEWLGEEQGQPDVKGAKCGSCALQ